MTFMRISFILALALIIGGCGKKKPTLQEKVAAFNQGGWEKFEDSDYPGALSEFSSTLELDFTNAEGHVGSGWSQLLISGADLSDVISVLDSNATTDPAWQTDAWSALATGNLTLGNYAESDSFANLVITAEPAYVFDHLPEVDWTDMLVIRGQSQFFMADYDSAWQVIQDLIPGSDFELIDQADSTTWVIAGKTYALFGQLLADILWAFTESYR